MITTTIYTASVSKFNTWSKFNSKNFHTVLVDEDKRDRLIAKNQFYYNSIPSISSQGSRSNFGKGFYFISEIGTVTNEKTGRVAYYANALYKTSADDGFNKNTEVLLYLNPLYNYSSIGRKDISYEELIGATIEVIKAFHIKTITTKGSYTTLNYEWRVNQFADKDNGEHLPESPVGGLTGTDFDNEDMMAFYGL